MNIVHNRHLAIILLENVLRFFAGGHRWTKGITRFNGNLELPLCEQVAACDLRFALYLMAYYPHYPALTTLRMDDLVVVAEHLRTACELEQLAEKLFHWDLPTVNDRCRDYATLVQVVDSLRHELNRLALPVAA